MDFLAEIKEYYYEHLNNFGDPQGCSEEEICALEEELGFGLPAAYRQYLEWMGTDDTGVFQGSDCFLDHVLPNNEYLQDFLAENAVNYALPDRFVAFFVHQGYHCAWFEVTDDTNADPVVQSFAEGAGWSEVHVLPSFTGFILGGMKELADYLTTIK